MMNRRSFSRFSGSSVLAAGLSESTLGQNARRQPIRIGQIGTKHGHASGKTGDTEEVS